MHSNIYHFNCANKELAVISQLRGRAYDRFKRSLDWLDKKTNSRWKKYNIQFFWQLAYLSKKGLNSSQNLKFLIDIYDFQGD